MGDSTELRNEKPPSKAQRRLPSPGAFNIWKENPPPRGTWVWIKYELTRGQWSLAKTCKRGCCVYQYGMTLIPAKYWKEASMEDAELEQEKCDRIRPIDIGDLYP